MLNKFYIGLGSLLLAGYSVMAFSGWEIGNPARRQLPSEVKQTKDYRSFRSWGFWYAGYRGGK